MITIRQATVSDAEAWLKLRRALWPDASPSDHRVDIQRFLAGIAREPQAVLLAEDESGEIIGLAELSIRSYAEGCSSDQVAFLEGWYVAPEFRRRGVGKALLAAAERWGVTEGCNEFASDAHADNDLSAAVHRQCGFTEITVIRCFRKDLPNKPTHATCENAGA